MTLSKTESVIFSLYRKTETTSLRSVSVSGGFYHSVYPPSISHRHAEKQHEHGDGKQQKLQLPRPFEPLPVGYVRHRQPDEQHGIRGQNHVGKPVRHAVGQNNECGRNAQSVGYGQNYRHYQEYLCRSRADEKL